MPRTTITPAIKAQVRRATAEGQAKDDIAAKLGISISSVFRILASKKGRPPSVAAPAGGSGELAALRKENVALRAALKGLLG